jgi:hypothetical protein
VVERVGGQLDPHRSCAGRQQGGPVHRHATDEDLGRRGGQPGGPVLVPPDRPDREHVLGQLLRDAGDRRHQYRMGAQLDEDPVFLGDQLADGRREQDRLTQVAVPVVGVERLVGRPARLDRRVERDVWRRGRDRGEVGQQCGAHTLHVVAV